MPEYANWRGSGRGLFEQLYTVRCRDCRCSQDFRAADGILEVTIAARWAREAGWSLSGYDQRWRCQDCAKAFRRQKRKVAGERKGE